MGRSSWFETCSNPQEDWNEVPLRIRDVSEEEIHISN